MQSFKLLRFHQLYTRQLQPIIVHIQRPASHYQRPKSVAATFTGDNTLKDFRLNLFNRTSTPTSQEWRNTRQLLINDYKHVHDQNVDAIILGLCTEAEHLPVAKSYVDYLRANNYEPNTATLGRLLRVYNAAYHANGGTENSLTTEEQEDILEIYAQLREKYEILDATTCEQLIHGLVVTAQWRNACDLLKMIKLSATPSINAYGELAAKAFTMSDLTLGWSLLDEMIANRKQPKCGIYIAYLREIAKETKTFPEQFERLLNFLREHELVITQHVVNCINELAMQFHPVLSSSQTVVNRNGKCAQCAGYLENVCLSNEQFNALSESFMQKVLIRNDVFQKSSPEEVKNFKRFVEETAPYDCVIDGLNVAYSMGQKKSPKECANLLAAVVKYFKQKNKYVLVLGRKHMNRWSKPAMQYISQNAAIFLTNNLTHDDPFLLYATLASGDSTDFFSRDLMRTHAHLLGPELKTIFRHWQQQHQYSLVTQTTTGKIIIKEPLRYLLHAHKVHDYWHVPYKSQYTPNPPDTFESPEQWLCLRIQNNVKAKGNFNANEK